MDAPRQPVPADFGVAEEDVSRLPKLVFCDPIDSSFKFGVYLATTILIAFVALNQFFSGDWSLGNCIVALLGGPLVLVLSAGLTMGCYNVLGLIENEIRMSISPTFRRASQFRSQFRSAMAGYQINVAEYEQRIAAQEQEHRRRQEAYWRGMSGVAFEKELARLFRSLGYKVSQTPRTGDGGVDLILRKDDRITVVQCKAHGKKIPIGVARELIASMQDFSARTTLSLPVSKASPSLSSSISRLSRSASSTFTAFCRFRRV
jgi:hypothetical protein